LAALHKDIHQYQQAEKEYGETLELYRELAARNPETYGIELCRIACFYGEMLLDSGLNPEKGLMLLKEALRIARNSSHPQAQTFIDYIEKKSGENQSDLTQTNAVLKSNTSVGLREKIFRIFRRN
jgi:lipopolysaccharide biosynthesis regulator YciM